EGIGYSEEVPAQPALASVWPHSPPEVRGDSGEAPAQPPLASVRPPSPPEGRGDCGEPPTRKATAPEQNQDLARGHRAPLGVWDGRGVMFVSHIGQIFPSGFLPIECGRFPNDSVVETYQKHPLFQALRQPDRFGGKCGRCEYRYICGGSRARAYAVTGDPLGPEPDCIYVPGSDCS
ncbi:MAG: hypothetical protein NZ602_15255, partial [Thermoguttaceae bacterium]|nr:hypothetical protein [Thermoguttaceae bacterium]MDW8039685.1 hypothetical protein [Thermoguttaceae bacterium]